MTTLREAAQQALEAMDREIDTRRCKASTLRAMIALRAALAQQAKPQGCDHCNHPLYAATKCRVCGRVTEQAEPLEPVAWMYDCGNGGRMYAELLDGVPGWVPLYTAPPQRKPLPQLAESQCPHPEGHPSLRDAWLDGWEAAERAHGIGGQE